MKILEKAPRDQSIEFEVEEEFILAFYSQSLNTRVEAEPEFEEVMTTSLKETTLELEKENSNEHKSLILEEPQDSCSPQKLPKSRIPRVCYKSYSHRMSIDDLNFKRVVVDAFVYHKFCKSRSGSLEIFKI